MTTLRPEDLTHCKSLLARGSKSFSFAARLLPVDLRDDAAIFYAYCRVADDLIDEGEDPKQALVELRRRLDAVFAGTPDDDAVDRTLHHIVTKHDLPRAPFDALLEGFEWDVHARQYTELSDVISYSARVASAVGVVMTMMMGVRDHFVLARACDLGAAMQLTNIARDVAEDATRGRSYLPERWLNEGGIRSNDFIAEPSDHAGVRQTIERLLAEADRLYKRSEAGMPHLPAGARTGVYAARLIYADIGRVLRERACNPMSGRAYTGFFRKIRLAFRAYFRGRSELLPSLFVAELRQVPLEEMRFLLPAEPGA